MSNLPSLGIKFVSLDYLDGTSGPHVVIHHMMALLIARRSGILSKTPQAEVVLRLAFASCNRMFDLKVNIGS
jgi:hypothetical protein